MNITTHNRTKYWRKDHAINRYMEESYLLYISKSLGVLCRLLDEYIYWMHRGFDIYNTRIRQSDINQSTNYSMYHIKNFTKLIGEIMILEDTNKPNHEIDVANKRVVFEFYRKILSTVDFVIGQKYYYGRSLTQEEYNNVTKLITRTGRSKPSMCNYDLIVFYISPRFIDNFDALLQEFMRCFHHLMTYERINGALKVRVDNTDRILRIDDIWTILSKCNNDAVYFNLFEVYNDRSIIVLDAI